MTVRSALLSTLKWLLALIVGLLLILFVVNLVDDDLNPEITAILKEQPPQIPVKENGYFTWIGVMAPENQAAQAWGEQLFQEMLATDKTALASQKSAESALLRTKRQETLKRDKIPCHQIENCLQRVAADPKTAEEALEKGNLTLARGDEASKFLAYQEAWRPDATFHSALVSYPSFWNPLAATRFALKVQTGQHDEALADLAREIAFHIRQSQGAHSLIEKLIAQNNLLNRYQLLGQYLQHHPQAAKQQADKIATLLAPLPADAASLKPAITGEARVMARSILSLKTAPTEFFSDQMPEVLMRPFFLPKASVNTFYQLQKAMIEAENKSGEEYRIQLAEISKKAEEDANKFPFALRNPIGHILSRIATPSFGRYFLKRDNLLATRALLAFRLDLLKSGINQPEAIAKAVESAALVHPYTGNKAKWNAEKRTIGYSDLPDGKELVIQM
ncbi:MAG: hypothetical protein H6R18_2180 [Proteobacteria bacterium]|nr:hypothetical protein [Pseudomonadota bacterium]